MLPDAAQLSTPVTDSRAIKTQVGSPTPSHSSAMFFTRLGKKLCWNRCQIQKPPREAKVRRWRGAGVVPRGEALSPAEAGVLCANIQRSGSDHRQPRTLAGAPVQRMREQVSVCAPGCVGEASVRVCRRAHVGERKA